MATAPPTQLDPWINRVLGSRYCLVAAIGRGGMGVVYRAWDRLENRYAVVKMPRAELLSQSQFRERFARELDVVRSLWHAAIVPVVDVGEEPLEGTASGFGMPYAVMPYLAGGSLGRRQPTRDGKPVADSPQSLWRWLPQIAEALDYVHREQLVHRDVKPDNILFDGLGDPHLGDFGIAKVVLQADAETRGLTKTGMSIGTPEYMAPELIGGATPDGRADQYALAVTVFEILAGRKPFLATSPAAVLVQQATVPAPRIDSMRRDLPQSAVDALERALAKKPEARFSSCEGFAHALLAEIEQPGEAKKLRLMCPDCGELLKVQPSWAGQTGKCPHCTKKLAVSADLRSLWLEADRSEAGVPRPVKRQSAIRRAVSWINGHGVAVAAVLGMVALIPALLIAFGLTGEPGNTAVTQDDLSVETLRDQLAVATASEQTARKALEESQAEVARLRADLEQAATDLADEMQAGQEREAVLRRDLAALQQPAEPRQEMAADAKATTDAAPAAAEPEQVAPSSAPPAAVAPFDAAQARKHQEEWAKHLGIEVETTNSIGQKFVVIPPGTFTMGGGDNTVEVTLTKPFLLGQTEVTNAQWKRVMGGVPSKWKEDDRPVETVDWKNAAEFCQKLSELPEEKKAGRVYRLPTEAEWEYACRAGTTTMYSFGNDESRSSEYGWYATNSTRTHPVGLKKPNAWQLFDMHGNVAEWCCNVPINDALGLVQDSWHGQTPQPRLPLMRRGFLFSHTRTLVLPRGDSLVRESSLGFRLALPLADWESKEAAAPDASSVSVSLPVNTPPPSSTPPAAVAPFDAVQARKHQEHWAKHLGIEVETTNSIGQKFVVIPPGTFTMGEGDKTVEVTLSKPFLLGQTEVTNAEWKAVMGRMPSGWRLPDLPVNNVTWGDAVAYCRTLSALPEEQLAGRVYRLPTEAEWEFACRAGTDTAHSFGNDQSSLGEGAWFAENSRLQTKQVGKKRPNAWRLHDMHGNVWEWCSDWYGEYPRDAATDPLGPSVASARVRRGQSVNHGGSGCRSAIRGRGDPSLNGDINQGFRIALSPSGTPPVPPEVAAVEASTPPKSPPTDMPPPSSTPPLAVAPFDAVQARKHQEEWAKHLGIEVETTNSIGQKFVVIPPGAFATDGQNKTNDVTLASPLYVGVHEVTNAQWKLVMGEIPACVPGAPGSERARKRSSLDPST